LSPLQLPTPGGRSGVAAEAFAADSLTRGALPEVDYVDVYAVEVAPRATLDTVARRLLGQPPRLVQALMRLRDAVVGPLGLKTSPRGAPGEGAFQPGERVGPFQVLARRPEELLLGEDDSHLDFRVCLRVSGQGWASLATLVRFRNGWGRAYFALVRPFHRLVVKAMLRRVGAGSRPVRAFP
jgi:hypothetical protein